jgi:hypothetical protein
MVGLDGRELTLVPLTEVTTRARTINEAYYEMAYTLSR